MAFNAHVMEGGSDQRLRAEAALIDLQVGIFPTTRAPCAALNDSDSGIVVVQRNSAASPEWGFGYLLKKSRAVPGYSTYVIPGLRSAPPEALEAAVRSLVEHARARRILEIQVDAYGPTSAELDALQCVLSALGFRQTPQRRTYSRSLFADLRPSIDVIFAGLHKTARQNIRAAEKKGLIVVGIRDPSLAPRMNELHRESMDRTGGAWHPQDWRAWMETAERHPELVELIGVFDETIRGPEALLAFSVGMIYGQIGLYSHAGSTRKLRANFPVLYAPLWLLMQWAKRNGAEFFDFGGVTSTMTESSDPLGGISSFKRYFSRDLRKVGAEYSLVLSPSAHAVACMMRWIIDKGFRSRA